MVCSFARPTPTPQRPQKFRLRNIAMVTAEPPMQRTTEPQRHGAVSMAAFFGLQRILFVLPYIAVLTWFHWVDVYHKHFSERGPIVVAYNGFRLLFIFYLFWIVATVGLVLLRAIARQELAALGVLERLALCFFAGAGIWHVAMLGLGYLGLYTLPVAVALTLPVVCLSYAPAGAAAVDLPRMLAKAPGQGQGGFTWLLLFLATSALAALLLVKGLYPGGGHDYFTHYFYYLQAVIGRGDLWPNDVWYHYYYSKGAGLFFLGMLITDPLAPQLVTFCFVAVAVLPLYLLIKRIAPGTAWPLVGVVLFLGIYISTPGSAVLYSANGGWGDFEKFHEVVAALIVAIIWSALEALSRANNSRIVWTVAAASAIVCAILIDVTIAVFIGGVFALLALFYASVRESRQFFICVILCVVTGACLVAILILNQLTTGLADDQGILFFWNYANVEKLAKWGALPLVILEHLGVQSMEAASTPLSIHTIIFLGESARFDIVAPLALGGAIIALSSLIRGHWNRNLKTAIIILSAGAVIFVAIALLFGRAQQVSFYRYASIATAPAIICSILGWNLADTDSLTARFSQNRIVTIFVLALCIYFGSYPQLTMNALSRGLHFVSGRYSIDTAYASQYGPPPRSDWSAIYPGARGAYEAVGPGTPIWSFHIHTYCMLPDCLIESYPSFLMTRQFDRVMFGAPEEAKELLQAAHLNYFLFSREAEIRDPLPRSALFSPDNIERYLGIRWTDGTTTLLTWLGPGVTPLDQAWIAAYRVAVQQSSTVQSFPYEPMQQIFARLDATPHPWGSFRLPWQAY